MLLGCVERVALPINPDRAQVVCGSHGRNTQSCDAARLLVGGRIGYARSLESGFAQAACVAHAAGATGVIGLVA